MTAVAMVAVMIVAAFAVVGLADSGVADTKKMKVILGTADNPYILNYSKDNNKNETVTASIEFNRSAFTKTATIDFSCTSNKIDNEGKPTVNEDIQVNTSNDKKTITITSNPYTITLNNQNDVTENGTYTVTVVSSGTETANIYTEFLITLTVIDGVTSDTPTTIPLPPQTYTFKAYIKAVDATKESIELEGSGVTTNATNEQIINFEYEKDYLISSKVFESFKVVENGIEVEKRTELKEDFKYYATGLPNGISMTVDGKIGGRLSSNPNNTGNGEFTVYAVSTTGHVVSQSISYSIEEKAIRGFTIDFNGNSYATTTVNKNVILTITPNDGSVLNNVVISYGEKKDTVSTIVKKTTHEIQCTGTGILKVSVSAQVDGSNVTMTKTVTIYVVGKIFDTDLDPEVTN